MIFKIFKDEDKRTVGSHPEGLVERGHSEAGPEAVLGAVGGHRRVRDAAVQQKLLLRLSLVPFDHERKLIPLSVPTGRQTDRQ